MLLEAAMTLALTAVRATYLPPPITVVAEDYSPPMAEDDPGWQCNLHGNKACANVPVGAPQVWQDECYLLILGTAAGVGYLPIYLPYEYWNGCIDLGALLAQ